jgi:hypothetical protein
LERQREKERVKERKSFTEILSFLERFSPHVEIHYIFCRALSLQKRENLSTFEFLSLSLPLPSFSLNCKKKSEKLKEKDTKLYWKTMKHEDREVDIEAEEKKDDDQVNNDACNDDAMIAQVLEDEE